MRLLSSFFFILLLVIAGNIFLYFCTDHFQLRKIQCSFIQEEKEPEANNGREFLKKRYYYLGKGHHVYAFVSEDKTNVLKFIRENKFKSSFFKKICKKENKQKKERLSFLLNSMQLAEKTLKRLTGIEYLHLTKTRGLEKVCLFDKMKRKILIDPNAYRFIVQKKVILYEDFFPQLIYENDYEKAKVYINGYFEMLAQRTSDHIVNKDRRGWMRNYGIDKEGHFYEIDNGSYRYEEKLIDPYEFRIEIGHCAEDFRKYLYTHCRDLHEYFLQQQQRVYEQYHVTPMHSLPQ